MKNLKERGNQLALFSSIDSSKGELYLCEQVVIRLILAGIYPFYIKKTNQFTYLIDKRDKIIGTTNSKNFADYYPNVMYYRPEMHFNDEEREQFIRFKIQPYYDEWTKQSG